MSPALLTALGGGLVSALLHLSLLTSGMGALILAWLAPLPLLLVGLSQGFSASLIAGALASAVVGLVGGVVFAVSFGLAHALPVALVVRQSLLCRTAPDGTVEWYPPGWLLMWLSGVGVAFVVAGALLTLEQPGGLRGAVEAALATTLESVLAAFPDAGSADARAVAAQLAAVFPGLVIISWLLMVVANGALAQGLLVRFGRNLRPSFRLEEVDLPPAALYALAAAAALAAVALRNDRLYRAQRRDGAGGAVLLRRAGGDPCLCPAQPGPDHHPGGDVRHAAAIRLAGPAGGRPWRNRPMGRAAPAACPDRSGSGGIKMVEVILLERVEKLGQMGDVVKVRPGYARNYLLPQKKALRATKENLAYFQTQKAQLEAINLERRKEAEQVAERMKGLTVVITRQAGESGQLYGSVTARDIAEAITEAGFTVSRRQVAINQPIKTLGLFPVRLILHPEVSVEVTVNVARTLEEADLQAQRGGMVTAADLLEEAEAEPTVEATQPDQDASLQG